MRNEGRRTLGNRMTEMEGRYTLIEGVDVGLSENLALEKFPGIHRNDSS